MSGSDRQILTGTVIRGLHNGSLFGFPTANIRLSGGVMPAAGVYAARLLVDGQSHNGMLYAGTRPTLKMTQPTVEIHLFDFNGDIYGKCVRFEIVRKIRDEQTFPSVGALIEQLHHDKQEILALL